jgi:FimV-like protein
VPARSPGFTWLIGLLGALLWSAVSAQGISPAPASFQVTGTLISPSGRSALINGQLIEEGDQVAGARVVAIHEGTVRMRIGSRELAVNVGSSIRIPDAPSVAQRAPSWAEDPEPAAETGLAAETGWIAEPPVVDSSLDQVRAVQAGETLSGIARELLTEDITLDQMMVGLFHANPQAFGGNIHLLFAGAALRVPEEQILLAHDPYEATAEVVRLSEARAPHLASPNRMASVARETTYGPVASGDTLSAIAQRLVPADITLDQMMLALLQQNPGAFGDNIHVLYAGATLRIPAAEVIRQQSAETARNEVLRQTRNWREATGQAPFVALAQPGGAAARPTTPSGSAVTTYM